MKNNLKLLQIAVTILSIFLLPSNSKAQIEDIQVGATIRKMLVYAPSGIESNRPLLLSMHGLNQDIAYQQNQSQWETIAKAENFVLVYPGGINNSWDISGTTDTDFILAIIDEMYSRYGIDRNRVYLSGFSMGGMMTYHAATKIADKIAAFAPVSGYLMGGPNTNSSRPIPIIHTHGTTDDVVPYSGVQTCLDAWIARNNCPDTGVVTKPYPADKPNSTGTKYYWGPGTDSVEIVLLSIANSGHWHSNNTSGIHTSQEIWDFCKNFSLGFGVPKVNYTSVTNNNPKQILVDFSLPIKQINTYDGFTVKIDSQVVTIDSVVWVGSHQLVINLSDNVLNTNDILLSYANGNIVSTYEKNLESFNDIWVENLLAGAPPRIIELSTTENGDTLKAKFNKKMLIPSNISSLSLNAEFNENMNIPVIESSFFKNDSTILAFTLGEKIYADYKLLLSYSGNTIVASDSSSLKIFTNLQVTNSSTGLPVQIVSGQLEENAFTIALEFSKPMSLSDDQLSQISFTVNGEGVSIKEFFVLKNNIRFNLTNNLHHGDVILSSYNQGDIAAADKGLLEVFSDFTIENQLGMPTWLTVPGIIEAENFTLQFGTDTETTGDEGAGLNVGWTDTGDWLEYAIENNTDETEYEILFRIAAQSSGSKFDYYVDDVKIDQLIVPSTGGWQIWQSVVKNITLGVGKHYLKIKVVTGGFNLNYFDIQKEFVSINNLNINNITIFPNPASSKIVIKSNGFEYNKVEIIDLAGKTVISKSIPYEREYHLPISLTDGIYTVKISNGITSKIQNIIIKND